MYDILMIAGIIFFWIAFCFWVANVIVGKRVLLALVFSVLAGVCLYIGITNAKEHKSTSYSSFTANMHLACFEDSSSHDFDSCPAKKYLDSIGEEYFKAK